jgi:hypothetical protein
MDLRLKGDSLRKEFKKENGKKERRMDEGKNKGSENKKEQGTATLNETSSY